MPSSALLQLTVAKRRDAEVDSSGSFSFPMLLLSMIAELGPSTIGTGTNNIGINVDAWDRFSFLIMSLALRRSCGCDDIGVLVLAYAPVHALSVFL